MKKTQLSFNAGELSPLLHGKIDLAKYENGCSTLKNFFCLAHGPATRRPGTEYISATKDSTKVSRLIPFEFSVSQAYVLEFGEYYIRFYRNGAPIVLTIANATAWAGSTTYALSDMVKNGGAIYRCILAHTSSAGDEPGVGGSWATYWVQDDTYEIASPYAAADVGGLDYAQSADIMYLSHVGHLPRELKRIDHDVWTLGLFNFINGPWESENVTDTTIAPSARSGSGITLTAGDDVFTSTDVGRLATLFQDGVTTVTDQFDDGTYVGAIWNYVRNGNYYQEDKMGEFNTSSAAQAHILYDKTKFDRAIGQSFELTVYAGASISNVYIAVLQQNASAPLIGTTAAALAANNIAAYWTAPTTCRLFYYTNAGVIQYWNGSAWAATGVNITIPDDTPATFKIENDAVNARWRIVITNAVSGANIATTTWVTWALTRDLATDEWFYTGDALTDLGNGQMLLRKYVRTFTDITPGSGGWGIAKITGYTDAKTVTADVINEFPSISPTVVWKLGAWSETTGYPKFVTFDDTDRLWWAYTNSKPQTIWGSKVGVYNDYGVTSPLRDDDALDLTLNAKLANFITWLLAADRLAVGTEGNVRWISGATGSSAVTANSKRAKVGANRGASGVPPVTTGEHTLFLQRFGKVLREIKYSFEADSYEGAALTLLAEHLTREYTITQMAYQQDPNHLLWCVRSDGALLGLTYYPEHEVYGWHTHETEGSFEAVCTIPGSDRDEVWLIVNRTINGATKRYVERMAGLFDNDSRTDDAFFVDCGLSLDNRQTVESIDFVDPGVVHLTGHGYLDGDKVRFRTEDTAGQSETLTSLDGFEFTVAHKTASTLQLHDSGGNDVDLSGYKLVDSATVAKVVTSISGLDHLEGEEVDILADGAPHASKTVASGAITISGGSVVHVGLGYTSDLETFTPEAQFKDSSNSIGVDKTIVSAIVQLYQTLGGQIGADADNLSYLNYTSDAIPESRPAPVFSGYFNKVNLLGPSTGKDPKVFIRQDQPLPMTVVSLTLETEVGD